MQASSLVLHHLFIMALWWAQGSLSVTNGRQRLSLGGQSSNVVHRDHSCWPSPAWLPPASLPQTCSSHCSSKISPWYIVFPVRLLSLSFLSTSTPTSFSPCRQHTAGEPYLTGSPFLLKEPGGHQLQVLLKPHFSIKLKSEYSPQAICLSVVKWTSAVFSIAREPCYNNDVWVRHWIGISRYCVVKTHIHGYI